MTKEKLLDEVRRWQKIRRKLISMSENSLSEYDSIELLNQASNADDKISQLKKEFEDVNA